MSGPATRTAEVITSFAPLVTFRRSARSFRSAGDPATDQNPETREQGPVNRRAGEAGQATKCGKKVDDQQRAEAKASDEHVGRRVGPAVSGTSLGLTSLQRG
jgi:hypothetical protein